MFAVFKIFYDIMYTNAFLHVYFACASKTSSAQSKLSPDAAEFEPRQQLESHSEVIDLPPGGE